MKHDQSGWNFVGLIHLVRESRAQKNVGRANPRVSMRNARAHLARSRDLRGDRAPIPPQAAVAQGSRAKHQQPTASGMVRPYRSRPSVKDSRQSLCWARCAELRALPRQAMRVSGVLCLQDHETFPRRHIEGTSRARPPPPRARMGTVRASMRGAVRSSIQPISAPKLAEHRCATKPCRFTRQPADRAHRYGDFPRSCAQYAHAQERHRNLGA